MKYSLLSLTVILVFALVISPVFALSPVSYDEINDRGVIVILSNVDGAKVVLLDVNKTIIASGVIQNGKAEFETHSGSAIATHAEVSAPGYNTELRHVLTLESDGVFTENIRLEKNPSDEQLVGIAAFILLAFACALVIWDTRNDY